MRWLWTDEDYLWFPDTSWNILILRCAGYGTASVLFVIGLSALEMQRRIRMPSPLVRLREASYLLYLAHVPGLVILGASERHLHLLRYMPRWVLAALFIVLIISVTILLNITIEKPLLRKIRQSRRVRVEEAPPPHTVVIFTVKNAVWLRVQPGNLKLAPTPDCREFFVPKPTNLAKSDLARV